MRQHDWGFPKIGLPPVIIQLSNDGIFPCKPSIWVYPHFRKPPFGVYWCLVVHPTNRKWVITHPSYFCRRLAPTYPIEITRVGSPTYDSWDEPPSGKCYIMLQWSWHTYGSYGLWMRIQWELMMISMDLLVIELDWLVFSADLVVIYLDWLVISWEFYGIHIVVGFRWWDFF